MGKDMINLWESHSKGAHADKHQGFLNCIRREEQVGGGRNQVVSHVYYYFRAEVNVLRAAIKEIHLSIRAA